MYRIFRVLPADAAKIDDLLKDDLVSRQSVVVRDARSLGVEGQGTLVLVEGIDEALQRAAAVLDAGGTPLGAAEADAAYRRFKAQDEEAASGLGLVFGP